MPANLNAPFDPSCCEGTYCNDRSAQYCGCDKGANHLCERHRIEAEYKAKLEALELAELETDKEYRRRLNEG